MLPSMKAVYNRQFQKSNCIQASSQNAIIGQQLFLQGVSHHACSQDVYIRLCILKVIYGSSSSKTALVWADSLVLRL